MPTDSEMILIRARRTMKQTKNEIIKQIFYRKTEILTLLMLGSFLAVLTVVPPTFSQSSEPKPITKATPTPVEKVLDEETADELIVEMKKSLKSEIGDKESVKEIVEKWDSQELIGKTRKQALEILFEDVKSVVEDKEITDKIWEHWTSDDDEDVSEGNTPVVLDDKKKQEVSRTEMGFFSWTRTVRFERQAPYSFKNQRYTIYTDPADPDSRFKIDAIKKAVEIIVNKGLRIPDDLQVYCSRHLEAQNRAFMRDENWRPVAYVTLRWGTDTPRVDNSLSARGFRGFERSTISMVHEIGHIMHERNTGDVFFHGRGSIIQGLPDKQLTALAATKVSGYAKGSKKEFVAEVFTGLIFGMRFDADVMAEYERFRGVRVPR